MFADKLVVAYNAASKRHAHAGRHGYTLRSSGSLLFDAALDERENASLAETQRALDTLQVVRASAVRGLANSSRVPTFTTRLGGLPEINKACASVFNPDLLGCPSVDVVVTPRCARVGIDAFVALV